ncbi:ATP-dependent helicase [Lolliginicoccus suaedae]|uniref:ATP-dependent helicase n=1 Tax=Lolliginicoccus suaedae TaxID=2605429 RepID=UPI0011F00F19|nr:ATP-dependent DNA helicase [Lolliginicoccus suaedae]
MSGRSSSRDPFAQARFTPEQIARAIGQHPPTEEQRAVITAPAGPVLVVAGAGAGKTETMAGRVIWLVTNGFVSPEEILGLTFTRKAAQQLGQRIRARLARIAGSSLLRDADPGGELRTRLEIAEPDVSTYHAYAGRLLSEHGLRLPIEPSATLLGQTELWQLAFTVVNTWDGPLDIEHTPATITDSVLALSGALDEHLIDIDELEDHPHEFEQLIETLPPGPRQQAGPSQDLLKHAQVQQHRRQLIPLVRRLRDALRAEGALDFGSQMSLAARVASLHPEVGRIERTRYRVVLLDEYQDTGHAQRVLLSSLYGGGQDRGLAVTAVGDPIQSIYGWRGASAANLPRFATDFPGPRGKPATHLQLLTSWRNPVRALSIANAVSDPLRARGIQVSILKPRPAAPEGDIRLALCTDVEAERAWVADHISAIYQNTLENGEAPPTAAVLIRRNRDAAPLAEALRERGLPVEVVGLGGLLDTPEVQDLVAMLRLVADPMAGTAAMRVLTGARWQLGARDITALWQRARKLALTQRTASSGAVTSSEDLDDALGDAIPGELAEHAAISDAIADPGDRAEYSTEGHRRITALAGELAQLRGRLGQPLTELVADVERTIGIGIEAESRCATSIDGGGAGREHLDAFADVVAGYSRNPAATLPGLLGYLQAAATIEKGLAPGETQVAPDRVQILTMHSAKGLEWEVVAIPHLCHRVFPSEARSDTWLSSLRELPSHLRGDRAEPGEDAAEGVPVLDTSAVTDRKQLRDALDAHKEAFARRGLDEERRLFYVAVTRTERVVLLSGHHWAEQGLKPKGPSLFLEEAKDLAEGALAGTITIEHWAPKPDEDASNPLSEQVHAASWPRDALGAQRGNVEAGAKQVRAAMRQAKQEADDQPAATAEADDAEARQWADDVDALLREREQRQETVVEVRLPRHLSVSNVVMLAGSPDELAVRLRRPLPYPPNPLARRGTAFHAWLERRYSATRLLDLDDLPGAADIDEKVDDNLEQLQDAFERSAWATRNPVEVEVPFETVVGGTVLRGRIDAVFRDNDGGWTVVDWKTGKEAGPRDERAVAMQLAAYRIAWADLMSTTGEPVELAKVRAAFHYVRSGNTVAPKDLPDRDQLRAILENPGDTAAARHVDPAAPALDH